MGYIEENTIMCISKSDVGVSSSITALLKTVDRAVMKWWVCAVWFVTLHVMVRVSLTVQYGVVSYKYKVHIQIQLIHVYKYNICTT